MRKRRQHSPVFRRKVVRYATKHGVHTAAEKHDVVPSVVNRWMKTVSGAKRPKLAKPNHLDTIILLRRAHKHDLAAIRSGGDFTFAGVYNWLALTSLTGEPE